MNLDLQKCGRKTTYEIEWIVNEGNISWKLDNELRLRMRSRRMEKNFKVQEGEWCKSRWLFLERDNKERKT